MSRWDDVRPALLDWETYRSGRGTVLEIVKAGVEIPPGILLFEDPPIHDAHRALLSRVFTPRRMLDARTARAGLRREGARRAARSGTSSTSSPSSVSRSRCAPSGSSSASPKPTRTCTARRPTTRSPPTGPRSRSTSRHSTAVLSVLADYVEWRSKNPGDDLMTELLNAEVDEPDGSRRPLTRDEVVTYACMVAGAGQRDGDPPHRLHDAAARPASGPAPPPRRGPLADPDRDRGDPAARVAVARAGPLGAARRRAVRHRRPRGLDHVAAERRGQPRPATLDRPRPVRRPPRRGRPPVIRLRPALLPRRRARTPRRARRTRGDPAPLARLGRRHRARADGAHRKRPRVGVPARPTARRRRNHGNRSAGDAKRVVVWSTGGIGSLSIVAVNERPDLELVGVWVHSEEKVGRDAGEIANGVPIGVAATNDVDALLALEPDCVIYAASGPGARRRRGSRLRADPRRRGQHRHDDLDDADQPARVRALRTASGWKPPPAPAGRRSTRPASSPGSCATTSRSHLSTATRSISKIHCYEIALYDDYGVKEIMIDALGFGQPLDFEPWIMLPGAIAGEFEGQVRFIADGLGVELDEVRETYDRRPTDRPSRPRSAPSNRASSGAIRFEAIGVVDGREAIVIDHITRLARHVGDGLADRRGRPHVPRRARGQAELRHAGSRRRWTTRPRRASRRWAAAPAPCSQPRCGS